MSLQTLFILRSVSHSLHSCVTGYFQVCQDYDFTHVGPRFNSQSFRIALARNVAVRQLNLCNHRDWLVDDTLQHVLEANCKLAKINLTGCSTLTSLTVLTLASCCPLLKELDLSNCHWLESEQFDLLASKCQDLERVSVSGCWNLNDDAIVALADSCKRLAVLPQYTEFQSCCVHWACIMLSGELGLALVSSSLTSKCYTVVNKLHQRFIGM